MKMENAIYLPALEAWHAWLVANHAAEKEAWLIFYKPHTQKPNISYEDAVEEALCYGWIDSVIQKIDEDCYARKFTPRTNTANWSPPNRKRIAKLLREGRMTEAGLAVIDDLQNLLDNPGQARPKNLPVPERIEQALKTEPAAFAKFMQLPVSQRDNYIRWLSDAKKPETFERRIQETLHNLEHGLPLGMK